MSDQPRIIVLPDRPKPPKPKARPSAVPQLIPAADAARRLGVDRNTIYRLVKAGTLIAHRIGRNWQVREDSILAYLAQHEYRPGRRA